MRFRPPTNKYFKATNMNFDHHHNPAAKAIQSWKDHLVGVLSGTILSLPKHRLCRTIPQAEHKLLLLRQSKINPKISVYTHFYSPCNYGATLFVPIGMETLVHDKPKRWNTFT